MKVKTQTKLRMARMFFDLNRMEILRAKFIIAKFKLQTQLDKLKERL